MDVGPSRETETNTRYELAGRTVLLADPAMLAVYALLRRLAASSLPVLITGETGVGKEHAALAVHCWSHRARGPFVTVNCAALPDSLLESELFGHERGAFTGAATAHVGLFEAAHRGTVFLDEVGELSAAAQGRLLRVLEGKRVVRLGSTAEREVDLRIVAATHRDLEEEVRSGRFREDLFYRLRGAMVALPPLRQRPQELVLLARDFFDAARRRLELPPLDLTPEALGCLCEHGWPGNVRELRNAMEFAAAVAGPTGPLECRHLPSHLLGSGECPVAAPSARQADPPDDRAFRCLAEELRELERRRMREALDASGGVQTRAAALIGMPLRTFVLKMKQHRLGGARQARARTA